MKVFRCRQSGAPLIKNMFIIPDHHKKGIKPRDFRDRKLIFIDLEMTGSNPTIHEIIEVGWLVVEPRTFKILSEFEAKVKPTHIETADPEGLLVAGYSPEKWGDAKDLKDVLQKLATVAPNGMLVGVAVYHDWEFLERGFEKFGIMPSFNYRLLPIDAMAYGLLYNKPKVKSISLRSGLGKYFKLKFPEDHGALVDARLSYEVFLKLMSS